MNQLAFKDPNGCVYIMGESGSVPPLAEGYEWTMVVRPDAVFDGDVGDDARTEDDSHDDQPEPARATSRQSAGILDVVIPLLTPQADQSPKERAQELIDALPEELRGKLATLFRALVPTKAPILPPFPGVSQ